MRNENELKNSGIRAARPVPYWNFSGAKVRDYSGPKQDLLVYVHFCASFTINFRKPHYPVFPTGNFSDCRQPFAVIAAVPRMLPMPHAA